MSGRRKITRLDVMINSPVSSEVDTSALEKRTKSVTGSGTTTSCRKVMLKLSPFCILFSLLILNQSFLIANGANNSPNTSTNANQTAPSSSPRSKTNGSGANSSGGTKSGSSGTKSTTATTESPIQQTVESQATDLSSMYVQIPIAESNQAGIQDGQQQVADADSPSGGDSTSTSSDGKATTWTGPWPKKFQIGYIKQSDLHQVLMESLKGDSFVSLGGASGDAPASPAATKTAAATASAPSPPAIPSTTPVIPTKSLGVKTTSSGSSEGPTLVVAPVAQTKQQSPVGSPTSSAQWPSPVYGQQQQQQVPQIPRPLHQNGFNFNQHQQLIQMHQREPKLMPNFHNNQHNHFQQQQPFQMLHNHRYQAQQQHQHPQVNFNSLQAPRSFMNHQQTHIPKMISMTGNGYRQKPMMPPQQFQFPEFPMKNQPKYTISNFPQQQQQMDSQVDGAPMAVFMQQPNFLNFPQQQQQQIQQQQQVSPNRPTKSAEYHSSWRPVSSEKSSYPQQQQQQQQQQMPNLNDGFDDGFTTPMKDGISGTGSMNRHPALNNYLGNETSSSSSSGKLSPAMISAKKLRDQLSQNAGTKSSSGTKSTTLKGTSGTKNIDSKDLSSMNRRRVNGTSLSSGNDTQTTTTDSNDDSGSISTTLAPQTTSSDGSTVASATTMSSLTSTTSSTTASSNSESDVTTEPDSEVIESETTEPSTSGDDQTTTTTSTTSTTTEGSAVDAASATRGSTESGEAEVSTLGGGNQSTASLPSVTEGDGSSTTSPSSSSSSSSTTSSSSSSSPITTTGLSREETTPVNGNGSSTSGSSSDGSTSTTTAASETKGEVESINGNNNNKDTTNGNKLAANKQFDSMSDEALLAAAVRTGSEIGKTRQQQQSRSQTKSANSTAKKTRSSERLVQQQQQQQATSGGRKTQNMVQQQQTSGKLTSPSTRTKASSSAPRSGKQVGGEVKGGSAGGKEQSAVKSASKKRMSSAKSTASASNLTSTTTTTTTTTARSTTAPTSGSVGQSSTSQAPKQKVTRMTQQSERLQQQPQIVSMTPAQAQSTAQTLASLLLSRCMQSTNCASLLDVCSTKQANIPLSMLNGNNNNGLSTSDFANSLRSANVIDASISGANWSMPVGLMSSNLMGLAQALQADKVLRVFAQWKETAENIMDQETPGGYTLILPSNEAIDRLPATTIDAWLSNGDLLSQVIDSHILEAAETIDVPISSISSLSTTSGASSSSFQMPQSTRVIRGKNLQINQHRDRYITINGKRLVYANQLAPAGGRIHVIDGLFEPITSSLSSGRQLDIMDTLKQCDKFDGFVTLAEGTGLTQILKQDGPLTVFVPSNEALRKIPDDELEVIKNNSTALREFLMYHVVNGSYFSQDLRDGQQLASILDMKPIQVGVRVDGCSRRLVEANTSPMRRPDIVAKNGVIHILDWYLSVRDNEWCDPIGRSSVSSASSSTSITTFSSASPTSSSTTSSAASTGSSSSERLQQLASDLEPTYATRMSLPPNHKLADSSAAVTGAVSVATNAIHNNLLHQQQQLSTSDTNNIIVSATPIGIESMRMTSSIV